MCDLTTYIDDLCITSDSSSLSSCSSNCSNSCCSSESKLSRKKLNKKQKDMWIDICIGHNKVTNDIQLEQQKKLEANNKKYIRELAAMLIYPEELDDKNQEQKSRISKLLRSVDLNPPKVKIESVDSCQGTYKTNNIENTIDSINDKTDNKYNDGIDDTYIKTDDKGIKTDDKYIKTYDKDNDEKDDKIEDKTDDKDSGLLKFVSMTSNMLLWAAKTEYSLDGGETSIQDMFRSIMGGMMIDLGDNKMFGMTKSDEKIKKQKRKNRTNKTIKFVTDAISDFMIDDTNSIIDIDI